MQAQHTLHTLNLHSTQIRTILILGPIQKPYNAYKKVLSSLFSVLVLMHETA
jgi:hypothetical protein